MDSLELLQEQRCAQVPDDLAEPDFFDGFQLPTMDLLDEDELTMPVVSMQPDEFRCSSCFLVLGRQMAASIRNGGPVCRDCA